MGIRNVLELWPSLYVEALRVKRRGHWSQAWVVSRETDICIEGFPRSANSFAHSAIIEAQPDPKSLRSATHTHTSAQVLRAVALGVPTVVCVRKPFDAVCGLLAFDEQVALRSSKARPPLTPKRVKSAIRRWRFFHKRILPANNKIFVAKFEDITSDYRAVSRLYIDFFNLPLSPYDGGILPPDKVMSKSFHIGPNAERDGIKERVGDELRSAKYRELLAQCDTLHQDLTRLCTSSS